MAKACRSWGESTVWKQPRSKAKTNGAPSTWLLRKFSTANAHVTFALAAFSLAFSIAISDISTPITVKFCCESQMALSPVPHPISRALQGAIGVVVFGRHDGLSPWFLPPLFPSIPSWVSLLIIHSAAKFTSVATIGILFWFTPGGFLASGRNDYSISRTWTASNHLLH